MWLVGAIWLLFYRLFMTDQGIGVLDAVSFGIGVLAEIPSGAMADHFGRKKLSVIGVILSAFGMSMQGLATGYSLIFIGQVLLTVGFAFSSGADEAFFYDSLDYKENESAWKKLVAKGNQVGTLVKLASYAVGGYLYTISPRAPFIASVVTIIGVLAFWNMPEISNRSVDIDKSLNNYVNSLKDGVKELWHKNVVGYIPIIVIVAGFYFSFGYGLLRPILLTRFNYGASAGAWVLVVCGLSAFILQSLQARYMHKFTEKLSVGFIVLFTVVSLVAGSFDIGKIGLLVILTIYVSEYLLQPVLSDGLNKHISPKHRATSLSAASFLKSLSYVALAPLIGFLNVRGRLHIYLIGMGLLFMLSLYVYYRYENKPAVAR